MDASHRYYVEDRQEAGGRQTQGKNNNLDSMKFKNRQNWSVMIEIRKWLFQGRGLPKTWKRAQRNFCGVMKMFCILFGWWLQVYTIVKSHQVEVRSVDFYYMQIIPQLKKIRGLSLNKACAIVCLTIALMLDISFPLHFFTIINYNT